MTGTIVASEKLRVRGIADGIVLEVDDKVALCRRVGSSQTRANTIDVHTSNNGAIIYNEGHEMVQFY